MKHISMFIVISAIFLYSCGNAKANTANNDEKKINEKFSYSGSKVTSNIGKIIESLMEK